MVRPNRLPGKRRENPIRGKSGEKPFSELCENSGGSKEDSPPPPAKKLRSSDSSRSPPQEVSQSSGGGSEETKARYVSLIERLGLNKNPETLEEWESIGIQITQASLKDPYLDFRPIGGGEVLDMNLIKKYLKQVEESDGFDVDVYPGPCSAVTFIPVTDLKADPDLYKDLLEMATLAVDEYNDDNEGSKGVPYEFEEIERATFLACSGDIYHITFKAREAETANVKTFQAKVFDGIVEGDRYVMLVRLKDANN